MESANIPANVPQVTKVCVFNVQYSDQCQGLAGTLQGL